MVVGQRGVAKCCGPLAQPSHNAPSAGLKHLAPVLQGLVGCACIGDAEEIKVMRAGG